MCKTQANTWSRTPQRFTQASARGNGQTVTFEQLAYSHEVFNVKILE